MRPFHWVQDVEEVQIVEFVIPVSQNAFPRAVHVEELAGRIDALDQVIRVVEELLQPGAALLHRLLCLRPYVDLMSECLVAVRERLQYLSLTCEGQVYTGEEARQDRQVARDLEHMRNVEHCVEPLSRGRHERGVAEHGDHKRDHEPVLESIATPPSFVDEAEGSQREERSRQELAGTADREPREVRASQRNVLEEEEVDQRQPESGG